MSAGLSKRRTQADAQGSISLPDLDHMWDDIDRILQDHDRRINEGGDDHDINVAAINSISRTAAAAGVGVTPTPVSRQTSVHARTQFELDYTLNFAPDPTQAIMVSNRGLVLTPNLDYTVSGNVLTLKPHQVPQITEGHIVVEGTPL